MLMFLLGAVVSLVLGIAANLLTPGMKPLWATVASWGRSGLEAQTRQKLKGLQVQLDQSNRFKASDRDLYLYLFRWLLGIIASFVTGVVCAFIAMAVTMTPEQRLELVKVSLIFVLFSVVCCLVILGNDYSVAGTQKKTATVEAAIAKLRATLPESRSN